MKKTPSKRSWFTTIVSAAIGLAIAILIFPLLPLSNWNEIMFFGIGALLVVLCFVAAVDGKKGTVKEIVHALTFWP